MTSNYSFIDYIMLIYTNTRSKKTRKQKAKQKAAWVTQQKRTGAPLKKENKFVILSRPAGIVAIRPGADDFRQIKSVESADCDTFKRQTLKYTGDAMIGISTMHKSNAVPVFSPDHAKDISKMRRG